MKVKDLIKLLQAANEESEVRVEGKKPRIEIEEKRVDFIGISPLRREDEWWPK